MTQPVQLRASLVWRDEVMGDVVLGTPTALTIGSSGKCTFVIPELGLPPKFPIIKPGNRGYLLTLGDRMRGTVSVEGQKKDVADFVARGAEGGGGGSFRATPIGGRDWGVVDLDESGDYKLFFQFVPVEAPLPRPTFGRYREIVLIGAAIAAVGAAFPTYTTIIVLGAMLGTALLEIVLGFIRADDDDFTRPAIAFSILLFALFLGGIFHFKPTHNEWLPPGPRDLTADYLVRGIEDKKIAEAPPPPVPAQKGPQEAAAPAAKKAPVPVKVKSATKGDEGAAGGKGDTRAADENNTDTPPPPDTGLMTGNNRRQVDRINNLPNIDLSMYNTGRKGEHQDGDAGMGHGTGFGVGDEVAGSGTRTGSHGHGRGGGGSAQGDFESGKDVDVKEHAAPAGAGGNGSGVKEAKVEFKGGGDVNSSGLSRDEVDRVVKSRKGTIQACYQKQVNRNPNLGGKLVVHFVIDAGGTVTSAQVDHGGSSLKDSSVESCVKREIQGLKFPAKGGAIVNYPFFFSTG